MSGPLLLPCWDDLAGARAVLVDTMRRYLTQIGCALRPGSVKGSDLGLRCLALLRWWQQLASETLKR